MPRPHKCRSVSFAPDPVVFKPQGVAGHSLRTVALRFDEFEALRLADYEGLYHDAAAERMGVSRPTFGRVLAAARHKVADALINGQMIVLSGGVVEMPRKRTFECAGCGESFEVPFGTGRPPACPACGASELHRAAEDRGMGGGRCRRLRHRGGAARAEGKRGSEATPAGSAAAEEPEATSATTTGSQEAEAGPRRGRGGGRMRRRTRRSGGA